MTQEEWIKKWVKEAPVLTEEQLEEIFELMDIKIEK